MSRSSASPDVDLNQPAVLVVHCVDTEGPLGGDARRKPDGSAEFFDNWDDILASLRELTEPGFRQSHSDSLGNGYRFNWFLMDFTGFRTNPKNRVAAYHDTYDHVKALDTAKDGFYWHYHVPPADGAGDHWSESWLTSDECNTILARRLIERFDFPEAFRAGGTIEDEPASHWLEQVFLLDLSNRVSHRSCPGADLYHFNWYGAPDQWGCYLPSHASFLRPGKMRRLIYRCIDLRSRYNELTQSDVDQCFNSVRDRGRSVVLSYFSHDNRDMRPETHDISGALSDAARRYGVPWISCTVVQAHQLSCGLSPRNISLRAELEADDVLIATNEPPYQQVPFAAVQLADGRVVRLYPRKLSPTSWLLPVSPERLRRVGMAVTSASGDKSIYLGDIVRLANRWRICPMPAGYVLTQPGS